MTRLLPVFLQRPSLALPPDEGGEPATRRRAKAPPHAARLHDPVDNDRLRDALDLMRAARLHDEEPGDQAMRGRRDEHRVGLGQRLHAGRDVRRVAEDSTVLGDHDEPGVHPNPHRESDAVLRFEPFVEHRHGVDGR